MVGYKGNKLFRAKITGACKDHKSHYIAHGVTNEGMFVDFTAASLQLLGVRANWRPLPEHLQERHFETLMENPENRASIKRAYEIGKLWRPRSPFARCLTLDGNMGNLLGFRKAGWNGRVITIEMDPEVAFAQKLMGAADVRFTGMDPCFSKESMFGGKACSKSRPFAEHLLLKDNATITNFEKEHIELLYLDYCGGPPGNQSEQLCKQNMSHVLRRLPRLRVLGLTMSKRRHANLSWDIYVDLPYGFELHQTFHSNPKVICWVFTRTTRVPRCLLIPGFWWKGGNIDERKRHYTATVCGYNPNTKRYDAYVLHDGSEVQMTKRALDAYGIN